MELNFDGPSFVLGFLSFGFCTLSSLFFVFLSVLIHRFARRGKKQLSDQEAK